MSVRWGSARSAWCVCAVRSRKYGHPPSATCTQFANLRHHRSEPYVNWPPRRERSRFREHAPSSITTVCIYVGAGEGKSPEPFIIYEYTKRRSRHHIMPHATKRAHLDRKKETTGRMKEPSSPRCSGAHAVLPPVPVRVCDCCGHRMRPFTKGSGGPPWGHAPHRPPGKGRPLCSHSPSPVCAGDGRAGVHQRPWTRRNRC